MSKPSFSEALQILTEHDCFLRPQDTEILRKFSAPNDIEPEGAANFVKNSVNYHSQRDPLREAKRQSENIEPGKYIICCSVGIGYICTFFEKFDQVLLIEPDAELLGAAVRSGNLSPIAQKLKILIPDLSYADELEAILPWLQGKSIRKIVFYVHRPAVHALPEMYQSLQRRLLNLLEKRSINQATIIKFQELWNKNILMSSPELLGVRKIQSILDTPPPEYALIVGAGPSLAHSLHDLKKYRKHYALLCADTSFVPLARNEIYADFVFSADPQWINHHFAMSQDVAHSHWIIDPVVNPVIPHFLVRNGAKIFAWNNVFHADQLIRNITGDRGEISHGGSVSTNAFDFAVRWGVQKIVLVGQDLSFSYQQAHMRGAVLESAVFQRVTRFFTHEMHNRKQLTALQPIPVTAIDAQRTSHLFTNAKMAVFINWFEARAREYAHTKPEMRLMNASADGVQLKGFQHLALADIFQNAGSISQVQTDFVSAEKQIEKNSFADSLENLRDEVQKLKKLYAENADLSKQLQVQRGEKALVEKLNRNDEKIKSYPEGNRFVSLNAQAQILEITESDQIVDPVQFYATLRNCCSLQIIYLTKILRRLR